MIGSEFKRLDSKLKLSYLVKFRKLKRRNCP